MSRKTTNVRAWGRSVPAYAERVQRQDGTTTVVVRVYDDVAGHYTLCHSLTATQQRHVIVRTLPR